MAFSEADDATTTTAATNDDDDESMLDSNHLVAAVSADPCIDHNLKLSPSSDHSKEHSIQQRHSKQVTTGPMFMNVIPQQQPMTMMMIDSNHLAVAVSACLL